MKHSGFYCLRWPGLVSSSVYIILPMADVSMSDSEKSDYKLETFLYVPQIIILLDERGTLMRLSKQRECGEKWGERRMDKERKKPLDDDTDSFLVSMVGQLLSIQVHSLRVWKSELWSNEGDFGSRLCLILPPLSILFCPRTTLHVIHLSHWMRIPFLALRIGCEKVSNRWLKRERDWKDERVISLIRNETRVRLVLFQRLELCNTLTGTTTASDNRKEIVSLYILINRKSEMREKKKWMEKGTWMFFVRPLWTMSENIGSDKDGEVIEKCGRDEFKRNEETSHSSWWGIMVVEFLEFPSLIYLPKTLGYWLCACLISWSLSLILRDLNDVKFECEGKEERKSKKSCRRIGEMPLTDTIWSN